MESKKSYMGSEEDELGSEDDIYNIMKECLGEWYSLGRGGQPKRENTKP